VTFDDIRPILSGLAGGAIALWLSHRLSRWIPVALNGKSAPALTAEHRTTIRLANALSFAGILGAIVLYTSGVFRDNDWRPLGVGVGLTLTAPLMVLPIASALLGRSVKECLVAYAIDQRMPVPVIYGVLILGVPLLIFSLVNFI
jgi:hypothetical protein